MDLASRTSDDTTASRNTGLDVLRATAILAVVAYHEETHCPADLAGRHLVGVLGHFGWAGVDLFFVLSGYLIASQYFARAAAPGSTGLVQSFYIRRFLRTLPPYFVVLAITYVVTVYGLGQGAAWPSLWTYALFLQNFGMPVASFFVSWSLCVEEHFYLVFPLLAGWLLARRSQRLATAAFAIVLLAEPAVRTVAWLSAHPDSHPDAFFTRIYLPTYVRLDGLTVGVALAALSRFHPLMWARIARRPNLLMAAGVGVTAVAMAISFDQRSFLACTVGFSLFSVAFGMLVASTLSPTCWLRRLRVPMVERIALLSYAMYLTHVPAIDAGYELGRGVLHARSLAVVAPLQAALVLLGAWALHASVERPMMRLRERWLGRRASTRGPIPSTMRG